MGRRSILRHFQVGTQDSESPHSGITYTVPVMACGRASRIDSHVLDHTQVTCPGCSGTIWRERAAATGLTLERYVLPRFSDYRSAYQVLAGPTPHAQSPEAIAFLTFPNGFGGSWQLRVVTPEGVPGVLLSEFTGQPSKAARLDSYASHAAALAAIPALREAHPEAFRTMGERQAMRAARRAQEAAAAEAYAAQREARVGQAADLIEALETLRTRLAQQLTNAEADALERAIRDLPGAYPSGVAEALAARRKP